MADATQTHDRGKTCAKNVAVTADQPQSLLFGCVTQGPQASYTDRRNTRTAARTTTFSHERPGDDMYHSTMRSAVRAIPAVTGLLCAAMLLSACGSAPDKAAAPPSNTPASASSTSTTMTPPTTADPTADAKAQVLAAYTAYWAEQVKAYAQASSSGTDIEKYATDKALGTIHIDLSKRRDQGIILTGAPTHQPVVESVDTASSPQTATIRDCLDISSWKPVNKANGTPLEVTNAHLRYIVVYTARTVGADWKMADVASHRDQPC
ncbi:hypothetical protein ACFVSN_30475 [Kitasatospora sp. NPDC057904]|uniref:hypothetical protein n=1 Tax=unclassified Kitasatospora TaxID=2633591 RepID=UPI0036DBA7FC